MDNANARRARAFRAGLVRAVALAHARFLAGLNTASDGAARGTEGGGPPAAAAPAGDAEGGAAQRGRRAARGGAARAAGDQGWSGGGEGDNGGAGGRRKGGRQEQGGPGRWDALREGAWHPGFDLNRHASLDVVKSAVGEAEAELAARTGSGSGDEGEGAREALVAVVLLLLGARAESAGVMKGMRDVVDVVIGRHARRGVSFGMFRKTC